MRLRSIVLIGLLGVVIASTAGCSQVIAAITPRPIIKNVKVAAKVASPTSSVVGKLKKGAPSDLPFWGGANVLRTKVTKSDSGTSWLATLSTGDEYAVVVAGMATGFQQAGWEVEQQDVPSMDSSVTVLTVTGSQTAGVVTLSAEKDQTTQIDYVITKVE